MDTSPISPADMDEVYEMDDEELVYVGDIDEAGFLAPGEEDIADKNDPEEYHEDNKPQKGDSKFVFTGHRGAVFCGCLSKDGKLAATGGEDDKAYLWNTETGEIKLKCTGHNDSVIFAEFNADESLLATTDMSGIIQVWRISDNTVVWGYNMGDTIWVKWHPAANVLFAGSVDGLVYMWKIPQGDCKIFECHSHRAENAAILPDGKRMIVGYGDGTLRIIDLKTASVLSSILPKSGHSDTITALDCHADNNLILSAAVDGKTILFTSQGKVISVLQDLNGDKGDKGDKGGSSGATEEKDQPNESSGNWVETALFCKAPGFQVAATGTINGEIFVWDVTKKVLRHKITQQTGMSKLLWKGTTSLLFCACLDGVLRCYDARTNQCVRSFVGHTDDILDIYISQDENTMLTASDDMTARILDLKSLMHC